MRWIVLLRAVNVGGHGKTPMAELRRALAEAGAQDVATYIQSGNIVMDHPAEDPDAVAAHVSDVIETQFGHRPPALAFTPSEIAAILEANPYSGPQAEYEPKFVTFHLFRAIPAPDAVEALSPRAYPGEEVTLGTQCLYHWPPKGMGVSKLAPIVPKALGVTTTARNLNSMQRILALA
ncbi:DUF1697 domain-containing protein [Pseudooceanicola atlanticus]|nr:DUF1697 domain-containing protein [Pseudooceanicola atlanticus]